MGEMWRVLDTGLRPAAQNIALDRALLEARHADEIAGTLRFYRYAPSVLLGSQQSSAHECHLDFCTSRGVVVQRRISGGQTIYCDGDQLAWALYLHRREVGTADMQAIARRIGHAAAVAVAAFGMDARFRARDDIEVDGRQIGTGGGTFDGDAVLYQGIVYFERDLEALVRTTRSPAGTQFERAMAATRERLTGLTTLLGDRCDTAIVRRNLIEAFESELAVEFHDGELSLTEHARYQRALAEIDTPDWMSFTSQAAGAPAVCAAEHKLAHGVLTAEVLYDAVARRVKQVWFATGAAIESRRTLPDLEAALSDTSADRLERNVLGFFSARGAVLRGLAPADFVAVMRRALNLPLVTLKT